MTVVLLVLKIIGMILLILLFVILALVLLLLFVPVRYHVEGSYHKKQQLTVRVSWLLHLVSFGLDMGYGENDIFLRIFGIRKNLTKADNSKDFEDTIQEEAKEGAADIGEDAKEEAEDFVQTAVKQEHPKHSDHSKPTRDKTKADTSGKRGEKIKRLRQRVSSFWERIQNAFVNIQAVIERIRHLLTDDDNREAFRFLGQSVFSLLKRIMPKKLKLSLAYSTGSPDTTGEILGVLALFPIGYQNRWRITPDFQADSFYVEADFDVRGRIFLYQILVIGIRVLLDKNCKKLYNELMNNKT